MKPVEASEILDLTAYEKIREGFLAETIAMKKNRRIPLGDRLTFIFENRDTVIFQIQEMTRAERTVREEAIAEEVAVYNELIPGDHELSATLMIEIPEPGRIRGELDRLVGIDEYVYLEVGEVRVAATFDAKQFEGDRISAVQYVKFPLGAEVSAAFRDAATPVTLRVSHPAYAAEQRIEGAWRESLVGDLAATG
jgi:hypothetical protein